MYTPFPLVGYYSCPGSALENTVGSPGDKEIVEYQLIIALYRKS